MKEGLARSNDGLWLIVLAPVANALCSLHVHGLHVVACARSVLGRGSVNADIMVGRQAASEDELRVSLGLVNYTTGKGKAALNETNMRPIEVFMCSVVSVPQTPADGVRRRLPSVCCRSGAVWYLTISCCSAHISFSCVGRIAYA